MKKKMTEKLAKQMSQTDIRKKSRAEQIANGTWMGRNVVHRSATDYNRQKTKLETKHMCENIW